MPARLKSGDKLPVQHRAYKIDKSKIDEENRTVDILFSTDEPAERWFGKEILDHSPGACDLSRLNDGGAFLKDHNDTQQIGVHESASISVTAIGSKSRGEGRAKIRFAPDTNALAEQEFRDMIAGVRTKISTGYIPRAMRLIEEDDEGNETWLVTKWEVLENSLVSIPLDPACAAGRARKGEEEFNVVLDRSKKISVDDTLRSENNSQTRETTTKSMETPTADPKTKSQAELDAEKREREQFLKDERTADRERQKEIRAIAKRGTNVPAEVIEKAIDDETTADEFRKLVFEKYFGNAQPLDTPSGEGDGDVNGNARGGKRHNRSIGETFVKSKDVIALGGSLKRGQSVGVEFPNISMIGIRGKMAMAQRAGFTSSDLSPVNITTSVEIIALGVNRLTIMDVIASGTIGTGSYKYARENGFGTIDGVAVAAGSGGELGMPRAKSVGERGVKPNWEPDLSTETANVAKVAITTKVPDEFLADFPSAMSYIDQRLPFMVDTETEFQILYGDGLNNNLKGIFSTAGVQTRAVTVTDDSTKAASIRQGLTDVQVGSQFEPDFIGFHPYDWETASLLKDTTGRFLAGGPYYIPFTTGVYQEVYTFWGKRVVVSTAIKYGKPIAGAGKLGAQALIREGMRIEMTNSNEDDFKRNLICLRAEHRLALPVYRPVAFIEFTGWPARA